MQVKNNSEIRYYTLFDVISNYTKYFALFSWRFHDFFVTL